MSNNPYSRALVSVDKPMQAYPVALPVPRKNVAPYLNAFISGDQTFNNEGFGRFNIMNRFFMQNPDLDRDQWFFQIAEMSTVLLPLIGTLSAFTTLWIENKLSRVFKQKYIDAINRDSSILDLIKQLTGKNLKNINLKTLRDITPLARERINANNFMLQRMNIINQRNLQVKGMIENWKIRYNERFAFIELFTKTIAYIVICVKMLLYMISVTADLKLQSVVSENELSTLVNVIARFIFIMKKMGTLVSSAFFKSLLKRLEEGFGPIGITASTALETVEGFIASGITYITVDQYLINLIMENIREIDFTLKKMENKKGFLRDLSIIFLPFAKKDLPIDTLSEGFRMARDFFVTTAMVIGSIVTSDIGRRIYKISKPRGN